MGLYDWQLTEGKVEDLIRAGIVIQDDLEVPGCSKFEMILGSRYQRCGLRRLPENMEQCDSLRPGYNDDDEYARQ